MPDAQGTLTQEEKEQIRTWLLEKGISLRYGWPHLAGLESEGFLEGWKLGFLLGYLAGERDHAAGRHDIASAYAASSRREFL